jgi:hypothetical protein
MKLLTLAVFALGASTLFAQGYESDKPFVFGFKVGVPVTDMFSASNTSLFNGNLANSNYASAVPRYTFGLSGEFKMPKHLRLEVDGLYKRAGYSAFNTGNIFGTPGYYDTKMNVWEIPALLKTNMTLGHVRPFIDFGASLRHISSLQTTDYVPGVTYAAIYNNSPDLHNRNSYGAVAGIGITFKFGAFEMSPEARYTRWTNQSFEAPGLRTNLDQGDVLLGISF